MTSEKHRYESVDSESGAGLAHWFSSSSISAENGIDHTVEAGHLRAYRDPGRPPREAVLTVNSANPAVADYDGLRQVRVTLQNQDPGSEFFAVAGSHRFHVSPGPDGPEAVELVSNADIENENLRCASLLDFE